MRTFEYYIEWQWLDFVELCKRGENGWQLVSKSGPTVKKEGGDYEYIFMREENQVV